MQELHTPEVAARWLRSRVTGVLRTDSRRVQAGDGFIAWPGAANDGRQYVKGALAQGAAACLVERAGVEGFALDDERVAAYPTLKAGSGPIADRYYDSPSAQLDVVAVTGTNGKTSTAWWLSQALGALTPARPCGLIGTLGVGLASVAGQSRGTQSLESTGLTTPDPVHLQSSLRRFVDEGFCACAMEASSIGIEERRLDGTRIRTAVFTNFTQDHLDYHGSMAAYGKAKAALFDWPGLQAAVLNVDDEMGATLVAALSQRPLDVWTVSCHVPARLRAQAIELHPQGLQFTVCEGEAQHVLRTGLIGHYNVANLLGVIAAMRSLGISLSDCVTACQQLHPVPGRMDQLGGQAGQVLAVIDYAHTPDALAQALLALKPLAKVRGGQLWCVFGCGGDRDSAKRPMMGAVAAQHADQVVVTSDNPRSESVEHIISQILLGLAGVPQVTVQADRALAIAQTLQQCDARDVVLIAGKGHETCQEVAGQKLPFSDHAEVQAFLARKSTASQGAAHG
jgi:UDP-N-acetylmuramoyl-L-alanyl-D-glutamate--2,6-diaminopimelate ligase